MVNIGMVGCGWAGIVHLKSLIKMENVKVVAFATSNAARLADAKAYVPDARAYNTGEEMLECEQGLDAVILCVTPSRHDGLEQLCAEKGIHMYIEKPIELDYERAEAINQAIKDANVITSVGYQERYNPTLLKAKAFLKSRDVQLVEASWIGSVVPAKWWRMKAESGGQIIEQSTHLFDMIRFLLGEGKVTSAKAIDAPAPGPLENDIEPASVTLIKMDNGAIGHVLTSCFLEPGMPGKINLTIWCRDGHIEYDWEANVTKLVTANRTETLKEPGSHHFDAVDAFVKAVETGDRSLILCDYADAMGSFKMSLDAQAMIDK